MNRTLLVILPFQVRIKRTATKNYTDASHIPAGIYYEEYIDDHWYLGTLDVTGEVFTLPSGFIRQRLMAQYTNNRTLKKENILLSYQAPQMSNLL